MAKLIASRRRFLHQGTVLSMATASGALATGAPESASDQPPGVPQWMREQGRPVVTPPYGMPSSYEHDVVRRPTSATPTNTASWSFTPLQALHGIITPNGLVFERHHAGVPAIDPAEHRLLIHGLVEQPLILGIDDLLRFPSVSRIHFLECSGNSGTEWAKANERTVQFTHGLLSCCEWTGVPLSTVLDAAGVKREARWVLAEGADAAAMARSVPMDKALDDALLVYGQNGERLRPEQGYPLRLLLPGFEGNMSIKWLRRLEASAQPFQTREETSKYTDLLPDGKARQFTFYMEAKSVITFPSGGQKLSARGPYEIRGIAWSGHGRIRRVDVSVDGGRNWQEAQLQEPILHRALTRFRLPWRWSGGPAVLQSRSIDESGYVQPTLTELIAARGLHSHYHNNAIQSWRVGEDGVVGNVHV